MKKSKRVLIRIMIAGMLMILVGCTFEGSQYSPEQVVQNALDETPKIGAYYAESETIIKENGKEIDRFFMKEWRNDEGKIRIETGNEENTDQAIAVNDGETLMFYEVDKNEASMITDPEVLNLNTPSPKEQADQLLKTIGSMHEISIKGEAEIAGRDTYRLQAKSNEKKSLIGEFEMWIDKENWMVLKTNVITGDVESETIYTKVDFKTKISNDLFMLDLPEDVKIQNLEDEEETTKISLEEVANRIGSPFFYFPEEKGIEITTIELDELRGIIERNEVNIDYTEGDTPLFSLSVFQTPQTLDDGIEMKMPGETIIDIRGQEGEKVDLEDFRLLSWREEGVSYSILLYDPALTFEEVLDMTTEMELME